MSECRTQQGPNGFITTCPDDISLARSDSDRTGSFTVTVGGTTRRLSASSVAGDWVRAQQEARTAKGIIVAFFNRTRDIPEIPER